MKEDKYGYSEQKSFVPEQQIKGLVWQIESATGYQPQTTFWQDFTIAETYGRARGVRKTFASAKKCCNAFGYKYLTELALVLNWKMWYHYDDTEDYELSRLYQELWQKTHNYACTALAGEAARYYFATTD